MRISTKFLLSISIIFIGYLCTLVVSFVLGSQNEQRLHIANRFLLPTVIESRNVLSSLRSMIKAYESAVLFGEESLFDEAEALSKEIKKGLEKLSALEGQTERQAALLKKCQANYTVWHKRANKFYGSMTHDIEEDEYAVFGVVEKEVNEAKWLNKEYASLEEVLVGLVNSFTNDLVSDHNRIISLTKIQRYASLAVFVVVLLISSAAVALVLRRVVGPVQILAGVARDIASGEYNRQAVVKSKDEIGDLAEAFNSMTHQLKTSLEKVQAEVVERIEAERALKDSETRFQDVAFSSADWIWEIDVTGRYTFIAGKVEELLGYRDDELAGKRFVEFMSTKENDFAEEFEKIASTKDPIIDYEAFVVKKDGTEIVLQINGIPMFDDNGIFLGYRGVNKDITKRKQIEEEIKKLNEELEDRVKRRTQQLEEAQKELVDKAHKAGMADIATGTLHNVGNLLNSVVASSEIAKSILDRSSLKGYMNANNLLRQHIDYMEEFITKNPKGIKLMQYYLKLEAPLVHENSEVDKHMTRLQDKVNAIVEVIAAQQSYAGTSTLTESLNLEDIVEDALTMQAGSVEQYNIDIIKEFKDVPKIVVQKTKLVHILINLINNAKDAMVDMAATEKKISIAITNDDDYAWIKFSDTGSGIPEEVIESVFAHGFTTKKGGHGFGLHSCANYMTEMGGSMWAESEGSGKGASFIMQFPLREHA